MATSNIQQIHQSLISLKDDGRFSTEQKAFFTTLLDGKSKQTIKDSQDKPQETWRPFAAIAKSPQIERKLGRISAAVQYLRSYDPVDNKFQAILRQINTEIKSNKPSEDKIKCIEVMIQDDKHPEWVRKHLAHIKKELARDIPLTNEMDDISEVLTKEISQTSWWDLRYKMALRTLRSQIDTLQKKQVDRWARAYKNKTTMDELFAKTTGKHYKGTIMLPVSQGKDYRLGDSGGECCGYALMWGKSIVEGTSFCGVKPQQKTPPFKPIKNASPLGERYPELNHLAPLTKNIATFQDLQKDKEKLIRAMSSDDKGISLHTINSMFDLITETSFFWSIQSLTTTLIETADKHPDDALLFVLGGYLSGHAMAVSKVDDQYHFFDSNSGWFRFDNVDDFKEWLPYYFKKITYNQYFHEAGITLIQKGPGNKSREPLSKKKLTMSTILASIVLSPLIALIAFSIITYQLIVRGLMYAFLSDTAKNVLDRPTELEETTLPEHSVDDFDVNSGPKKSNEAKAYYSSEAGVLLSSKSCDVDINPSITKSALKRDHKRLTKRYHARKTKPQADADILVTPPCDKQDNKQEKKPTPVKEQKRSQTYDELLSELKSMKVALKEWKALKGQKTSEYQQKLFSLKTEIWRLGREIQVLERKMSKKGSGKSSKKQDNASFDSSPESDQKKDFGDLKERLNISSKTPPVDAGVGDSKNMRR